MNGTYRDPIERSTRIVTSCAHCGAEKSIMVNAGDFLLWESGKSNINQCLSYLDKDEREMLISRTCNDCWINLFGEQSNIHNDSKNLGA